MSGTDGGANECDPLKQDCPSGQKCRVSCPEAIWKCKVQTGTGVAGASCMAGADCAVGFGCLVDPSGGQAGSCAKLCTSDADCMSPEVCGELMGMCAGGGTYSSKICQAM